MKNKENTVGGVNALCDLIMCIICQWKFICCKILMKSLLKLYLLLEFNIKRLGFESIS